MGGAHRHHLGHLLGAGRDPERAGGQVPADDPDARAVPRPGRRLSRRYGTTLPLYCVSTAFMAKTLLLYCVPTAFVAKTVPFLAGFQLNAAAINLKSSGDADDLDEAVRMYERARAIQLGALGDSHADTLLTQSNLGEGLVMRGKFQKKGGHKGAKKGAGKAGKAGKKKGGAKKGAKNEKKDAAKEKKEEDEEPAPEPAIGSGQIRHRICPCVSSAFVAKTPPSFAVLDGSPLPRLSTAFAAAKTVPFLAAIRASKASRAAHAYC